MRVCGIFTDVKEGKPVKKNSFSEEKKNTDQHTD